VINNYLLLYDASVRIAGVRLIGGDHPLQKRDVPQENVFAPRLHHGYLDKDLVAKLGETQRFRFSDPLFMSEGGGGTARER
jgi:hypothetical protein